MNKDLVQEAVNLYGVPKAGPDGVFDLGGGITMSPEMFYSWMSSETLVHKAESLKWKHWSKLASLWSIFYRKTYKGDRNDTILDFGCGSCFGVFVGRQLGFGNIYPFDRNTVEYRQFYTSLGVLSVWTYFKDRLPFEKNYFDSVISRLVLGNAHNQLGDGYQDLKSVGSNFPVFDIEDIFRAKELSRVLKPKGVLYISNTGRYKKFVASLERTGAMKYFKEKKIKFVVWR